MRVRSLPQANCDGVRGMSLELSRDYILGLLNDGGKLLEGEELPRDGGG